MQGIARVKSQRTTMFHRRPITGAALVITLVAGSIQAAASQGPAAPPSAPGQASTVELTRSIDDLVARRWQERELTAAAVCDDRAFARRIYLDLIGRIPTPEEVDRFVAEQSADKRAALADRLLASPEYGRHMRDIFDVVLVGRPATERKRRRGPETGGFRGEWLAYLERAFAENRPWDRMMADVLRARPESEKDRGAVWFLYARQEKYQDIAEAVSPAVFGVQIQCAQCHDHPLSAEIKQKHYWGLVAFFNRGKNKTTKQGPRVAESAIGGFADYATLTGESRKSELTFLGVDLIPEARPEGDAKQQDTPDLYRPLPDGAGDEPPVPKFSRREVFVEQVVRTNPLVARAAVNRFWALLMGRGLVHPVDKMDSTHPPSHPELLDRLAADFQRSGYDVKRLVRAIVLSRPFQLEARGVVNAQPDDFAAGLEKPLTAEMLHRSLLVAATGKTDTENADLQAALADTFPDVFAEENIATGKQTLFLTNSSLVQKLVQPGDGNTAERLATIADPAARVREAFRVAYARAPAPDELAEATAFLKARASRPQQAAAQLWWALLSGAEFRFNH